MYILHFPHQIHYQSLVYFHYFLQLHLHLFQQRDILNHQHLIDNYL